MRNLYYILDEHGQAVPEPDLLRWASWLEKADRRVAEDKFDGIRVSTVFRGLDHNHLGQGPPLLYETIIFGPEKHYNEIIQRELEEYHEMWRYTTRTKALAGHKNAVEVARSRFKEL